MRFLHKIYLLLLIIPQYYGLFTQYSSPLKLKPSENGKSHHIREIKRAQILEMIEDMSIDELRDILLREPSGAWEEFLALRMNEVEIKNALKEHLHYRTRTIENDSIYFKRQMITGVCIIAIGVWLNFGLKIMPSNESSNYSYRGHRESSRALSR